MHTALPSYGKPAGSDFAQSESLRNWPN